MAKRIKKSRLLFLIAIGLFLVLIIKLVFFFTAKPNIAVNYVAEYNKLTKPADYDPNKNAFFDYKRVADLFTEMPEEMSDYYRPFPDWPGDMNETQLNILRSWVGESKEALEYFEQGSKKPYYWYQIPEDIKAMWEINYPFLNEIYFCAKALSWRAKLLAFENKTDNSLGDLLTCYRVANQFDNKESTVLQLVGSRLQMFCIDSCFEILANRNIDIRTLTDFENKLQVEADKSRSKIDFTDEKYFLYDFIQYFFSDNGKGNGHFIPGEYREFEYSFAKRFDLSPDSFHKSFFDRVTDFDSLKDELKLVLGGVKENSYLYLYALTCPDRKQTIQMIDRIFDFCNDVQNQTPWQLNNKGIKPSEKIDDMLRNYFFLSLFISPVDRLSEVHHIFYTEKSALLTVIEAMRYKAEIGFYPESLSELVDANYLSRLPVDPYNNGPLTYKKIGDDFTLYSFGPDFDDDGGEILRDYDGQISRWQREGDTVFWPRPKETKEQRRKRIKEQYGYESEELLGSSLKGEEANDFNDIIIDSNNEN